MTLILAIATLGLALGLSLILTRVMIWLGPQVGLLDRPGERRIHKTPIPRAGGLAVWVTFMLVGLLVVLFSPTKGTLDREWYQAFAVTSGLLVLLGLVDDRWGVSPWFKILGQIGVAVILFFFKGNGVGKFIGYEVPWALDLLIWIVWTVGIINAFNLIDGLDGLCGGVAIISVGSLVVVSFVNGRVHDGMLMMAMLGAIGGFLWFNYHPARIFLGDLGSMFLGFFLASAATVSAGERAVTVSLLIPLLVAGIPFIDVVLAVWRRAARKGLSRMGLGKNVKVFGADKEHLHHRLLALGLNQRKVAMLFYLGAILVSAIALLPFVLGAQATGFAITAIVVAGVIGLRYIAPVELSTSGTVLHLALRRPSAGRFMAAGFLLFDACVIVVALMLAHMVEYSGQFSWAGNRSFLTMAFITLVGGMFGLRMAKAHSRHWARASLRDFWALVLWFAIGMHIAFTSMTILAQDLAWSSGRLYLLTTTFAVPILLLPRSLTPLIREALIDSRHRRLVNSSGEEKRMLLYGAGDLGELFLNHLKTAPPAAMEQMCIVGFLDDRPNLKSKIMDGFRIRGSVDQLEELADRFDLHGIVLTVERLDPERAEQLNRICKEKNLALYRWRPQLHIREITSQDLDREEENVVGGSHIFQSPQSSTTPDAVNG